MLRIGRILNEEEEEEQVGEIGLTRDFYVPDRYEFFGRNTIFPPV